MSLLVLLKNRAAGQPVIADDDDNEFLNIINCIAGVSSDKSIQINSNDNSFAVARFNQTGNNDILELYANSAEIVRVEKSGKLKSLVATGTAPIDVDSTTVCPNLNADKVDGIDGAAIAQIGTNVVTLTKTWLYPVLPGAAETTESQPRFIIPSAGTCKITKIYCVWAAGSDSSASNIFTIKRRNASGTLQSDVGTIELNTPSQNAVGENDIGDVTCTAKDQIYPLYTTRNNGTEQLVSISIEITQTIN